MPQLRRLLRILRFGLIGLLAMLAVALAVQSVRAYWKTDIISRYYRSTATDGSPRYHRQHFVSSHGSLSVSFESEPKPGMMAKDAFAAGRSWEVLALNASTYRGPLDVRDPNILGFTYLGPDKFSRGIDGNTRIWRVAVPWVSLGCAAGFIPLFMLQKWLRRARLGRSGHCPACGYDLRATPERCPECGHQVTLAAAA